MRLFINYLVNISLHTLPITLITGLLISKYLAQIYFKTLT